MFCSDDSVRCFQTRSSITSILDRLDDNDVLDLYGSDSTPQCFQGSGYFVVKCRSIAQRSKLFSLIHNDGNGHWHEGNTGSGRHELKADGNFWYTCKNYYSRPEKQANGFKKKIFSIVGHQKSTLPVVDFAVVQYLWANDEPSVFAPGRQCTPRAVTSALLQRASPLARGKAPTPRQLYLEENANTSAEDLAINPFCGPKGIRQATSCKHNANRKVFSRSPEEYLRTMPGVLVRQFEDERGVKHTNYILSTPYQIGLLAEACKTKHKGNKLGTIAMNLEQCHPCIRSAVLLPKEL